MDEVPGPLKAFLQPVNISGSLKESLWWKCVFLKKLFSFTDEQPHEICRPRVVMFTHELTYPETTRYTCHLGFHGDPAESFKLIHM